MVVKFGWIKGVLVSQIVLFAAVTNAFETAIFPLVLACCRVDVFIFFN